MERKLLFDSHIHIGQFRDLYSTPKDVLDFLAKVGIDRFAVSSSTTCEENFEKVLGEMLEIVKIGGDKIVPVLWISPSMLENGWLEKLLDCGIHWKCLKIHGYFSNWDTDGWQIEKVISKATELKVPLLFHTGGREESDAGSYLNVIARHPEQVFILAHSRPVDQAINVMEHCPNAWADTAFTPPENVAEMIKHGLAERILFGTDYPLHKVFYAGNDIVELYHKIIDDIKCVMSESEWELVSHKNFEKLFN